MMTLLLRLSNAYRRYLERKAHRIIQALYPDRQERAEQYAAMAGEEYEKLYFGEGDSFGSVVVAPLDDERGFCVTALSKEDVDSDV